MAIAYEEWKKGGATVVSGCLALAVALTHVYALSLFFAPLETEFGWKRTDVTLGLTIASIVGTIGAPFMGRLIDQRGSRSIALVGLTTYALGFVLLSQIGAQLFAYWAVWVVIAFGGLMTKSTVWVSGVVKWFNANRGLAIACLLCGSGLASTFTPSISRALIGSFGWRGAYAGLAIIIAAIIPIVWWLFDRNGKPAASANSGAGDAADANKEPGIASELFDPRFILLCVTALVSTSCLMFLLVHFIPVTTGKGIERATAAAAAGFIGVFTIIGRLTTGALLDRFRTGTIGAITVGLALLGSIVLLGTTSGELWVSLIAAALIGFGTGAEQDVLAYYVSRRYRKQNFGLLFGTIIGANTLAAGIGPLVGSAVFDHTGSYAAIKWMVWPALIASVAVFATLTTQKDSQGGHRFGNAMPARHGHPGRKALGNSDPTT